MNTEKVRIILDTDPGIDDAMALTAAIFHDVLSLELITTVAGNVSVEKTTKNALKLVHFWGKSIPVAQGAAMPLSRKLETAQHIHGPSGMEGYDFDDPTQLVLADHAVIAMRNYLLTGEDKLTLVAIGPLTNLALLFIQYPECKNNIERIVMMGGSASRGNHTPNAEFNIYADPEAAKRVFSSGVPIVMCGLDVTNQATLTPEVLAQLPHINKTGKMLHSLFKHYRGGGMTTGLKMHDLCAIAYLVEPSMFRTKEAFVDVETQGELTAGTTCVDLFNRWNKTPNATICVDINVERFRDWVIETINKAI